MEGPYKEHDFDTPYTEKEEDYPFPTIPRDPYITLGVRKNATIKEIIQAYRRLATICHSDITKNSKAGNEWFLALREARDVLSNHQHVDRRAQYYKSYNMFWGNEFGLKSPLEDFDNEKKVRQAKRKKQQEDAERMRNEAHSDEQAPDEPQSHSASGQSNSNQEQSQSNTSGREEEKPPTPEQDTKEQDASTPKDQQEANQEEDETTNTGTASDAPGPGEQPEGDFNEPEPEEPEPETPEAETNSKEDAVEDDEPDVAEDAEEQDGDSDSEETDEGEDSEAEAASEDERMQMIEQELNRARSEYATQLTAYKNKVREKKGKFKNIMADLGIYDKKPPETDKPKELIDAENAYIEAKKQKREEFFAGPTQAWGVKTKEGAREIYEINPALMEAAEKEYTALQKQILDGLPPLEKGIVGKSLEKWSKLSPWQRVAISTALISGTTMAIDATFGTHFGRHVDGVTAAASVLGTKYARSMVGALASQPVGKLVDSIQRKGNEKREKEMFHQYGKNIDLQNFAQKEKELTEFFEKEGDRKKKQRLAKFGVMVGTGVGVSAAYSGVQSILSPETNIHPGASSSAVDNAPKIKTEVVDHTPKVAHHPMTNIKNKLFSIFDKDEKVPVQSQPAGGSSGVNNANPAEAAKSSPSLVDKSASVEKPVQVSETELSSKGFIQDIENIKTQLRAKYVSDGIVRPMPKGVREFMDTNSTKLAIKHGMYDPKTGQSGMGYAGEKLTLDSEGHLSYKHGGQELMQDDHFKGKMFTPKPVDTHISPAVDSEGSFHMSNPDTSDSLYGGHTDSSFDAPGVDSPHGPAHVDSVDIGTDHIEFTELTGVKTLVLNGTHIAHEYGANQQKILALDDVFQDGKEFSGVRSAYVEAVHKLNIQEVPSHYGMGNTTIPFESGQIHISHGDNIVNDPNAVVVYLNGKEIARGAVMRKGIDIELNKGLKNSFLLKPSVYQRAFDEAKDAIKSNKFKYQSVVK